MVLKNIMTESKTSGWETDYRSCETCRTWREEGTTETNGMEARAGARGGGRAETGAKVPRALKPPIQKTVNSHWT